MIGISELSQIISSTYSKYCTLPRLGKNKNFRILCTNKKKQTNTKNVNVLPTFVILKTKMLNKCVTCSKKDKL